MKRSPGWIVSRWGWELEGSGLGRWTGRILKEMPVKGEGAWDQVETCTI